MRDRGAGAKIWVAIVAAMLVVGGPAHADKAASAAQNDVAKTYFATGRWQEAIAAWEKAYAESPAPEYLHSIDLAQETIPAFVSRPGFGAGVGTRSA